VPKDSNSKEITQMTERTKNAETSESGDPKYMSYSRAAWYTGLSIATLRRRAEEGRLEVIRHGGRILIERGALDSMLHAGNEIDDKKDKEDEQK
jgi:excisionase family DNA binding protein